MGRMKEIYIDLMNRYGEIPENFSYERWIKEKEATEHKRKEICSNRTGVDNNRLSTSEEENKPSVS